MKKLISVTLLSFILSSFNPHFILKSQVIPLSYNIQGVQLLENNIEDKIIKPKDLNLFLEDIGFRESSNRYHIKNKYGYLGKYQFGRGTLRGLGYNVSSKQFLNNPKLQEEAMLKLLKHNRTLLQKYINKYEYKIVRGIFITESGILAAAHLGGAGNVKKWFRGKKFKDGFGTSLSSYMNKFSGYDLKYLEWKN